MWRKLIKGLFVFLVILWVYAGLTLLLNRSTQVPFNPVEWSENDRVVILNNGQLMPILGFGTAGLRHRQDSIQLANELGYFMFDTASDTGPWYKTEKLVAELFQTADRENYFIVTKLHPQDHGTKGATESILKSLSNLQTTYIDLYLIHYPHCWKSICNRDPEGTWEDSWAVMESAYHKGQIRALGVSNFDLTHMQRLIQIANVPPAVLQVWYDPLHKDADLLEFCRTNNIQLMSYSSLGAQWVATRGENLVLKHPVLVHMAELKQKSVSQIVLRWLIQNKIVVIPKSESEDHMIENLDIFDWSLTEDEMTAIHKLEPL